MVATGLATTLANDGTLKAAADRSGTILLVECNTGRPSMSHELGISALPGLVEYLERDCALEDALRETEFPRLWVMPSGERGPNFSVLIRTPRMRETIAQLRERFDLIIIDLPSALNTTDLQILARLTDQILLVVRSGLTPAKLVKQAVKEVGTQKLAGTVLNGFRSDLPGRLAEL